MINLTDEEYILYRLQDEINFHRELKDRPLFERGIKIALYRIGCKVLGISERGDAIADELEMFQEIINMEGNPSLYPIEYQDDGVNEEIV